MTDAQRRNRELKAWEPDLALFAEKCAAIGAEPHGTIAQRDTYFKAARGKLKLREYVDSRAELIQYERADGGERVSNYRVVSCSQPSLLRAALIDALGELVTVKKQRQLFLWRGVRIHLDSVASLGTFIEIEAPIHESGSETAANLVAELRQALGITDDRLVTSGYADQLIRNKRN